MCERGEKEIQNKNDMKKYQLYRPLLYQDRRSIDEFIKEDPMWAELCMENRENMLFELDNFMGSLQQYRDALAGGDRGKLAALLEEGKHRKEEIDG